MAVAAAFSSPHPRSWFQIKHNARRSHLASGNAAQVVFDPIAGHAAAATTPVTGNAFVDPAVGGANALPATVSVAMVQSSTAKGTQPVAIAAGTGAFSATFPANTCTAGAGVVVQGTLVATTVTPAGVGASAAFTLT